MKRLTILIPLAVLVALAFGFVRARIESNGAPLPSFAPTRPQEFAQLAAPVGASRLHGRVLDLERQPLAGVDLYLRSNDVPFWTTSDAQGRFAFEGLGDQRVQVAALIWGRPPRLHDAQPGDAEFELVLAEPNPPPRVLPDVVVAGLAGRVVHPLGQTWSDPDGYEIAFVPRAAPSTFGGAVERRVHSDRRGFFFIEDLARGSYDLAVMPAWAAGTSFPDLAAPGDAQFEHVDGALDNVVVGLNCGALEGDVADADGAPLEGAMVLLAQAAEPERIWPPQPTDGLGHFRFADLPPGAYRLSIRAGEGKLDDLALMIEHAQVARPALAPLAVRRR